MRELPPFPDNLIPASPEERLRLTQYGELCARMAVEAERARQECHCEACDPIRFEVVGDTMRSPNMRMIVCSICGNKRCPHATDHRNACTGSNDVGQRGSSWEHVKPFDAARSGGKGDGE